MQRNAALVLLVLVLVIAGPSAISCATVSSVADAAVDAAPWLDGDEPAAREDATTGRPFVAVTYNLHTGLGGEPAFSVTASEARAHLKAIARSIAKAEALPPDVIALNEIDFDSDRTGRFDQATFVATEIERLTGFGYEVRRLVTWRRDGDGERVLYGSALLSRHPISDSFTCSLADGVPCRASAARTKLPSLNVRSLPMRLSGERRGILKATLDVEGAAVDVLVTHLEAFNRDDREAQAAHIVARFLTPGRTAVLMGDMNSVPQSFPQRGWFDDDRTHDVLTSALVDARMAALAREPSLTPASFATFPSSAPKHAIDGIFATADLVSVGARRIGDRESDHLGLLASYVRPDDAAALSRADERHRRMRDRQLHRLVAALERARGTARVDLARFIVDATRFLDVACAADRALILGSLPETERLSAAGTLATHEPVELGEMSAMTGAARLSP